MKVIYSALTVTFSFLFFFSFSFLTQRNELPRGPFGAESRIPASIIPKDITNELLRFTSRVQSARFTLETCQGILQSEFSKLNSYRFTDFDLNAVKADAFSLSHQVFNTRMTLREKYLQLTRPFILQAQGQIENLSSRDQGHFANCAWAFRRAFRGLRVLEDYLGEAATGFPFEREREKSGSLPAMLAFEGGPSYLQWNKKFHFPGDKYVPQSGDVILSRGTASTSAAIARISDEDTNFSHLSMVWVDPSGNPTSPKIETIESHIEIGSDLFSWGSYVGDGKSRAVIFRFRDPSVSPEENARVAHEAASKIRNLVAQHKVQTGQRICYDFAMNMNDEKCIFCSEIIRIAFNKVGRPGVPFLPSPIQPKNRKFIQSIGVTAHVTFAPADIELDPRFELVGEWRDHRRLHRTHFMDAVLTSMYRWMDDRNYELRGSLLDKFASYFGYSVRRIPVFSLPLQTKLPLNMKREAMESVIVLNTVVNRLTDYLDEEEKKLPGPRPQRFSPFEMEEALEKFRAHDERLYREALEAGGGALDPTSIHPHHFHSIFRN